MSSIRELKKDIHFLTTEIFAECYVKQFIKEDVDKEKLAQIMVDAVKMENEFISRTNHYDAKDNPKLVKEYFKKLRHDLYQKYIELSESIEKL
ncbi:MAG: hypothetical protein GXO47_07470 [Chlorobi bacterium]|nr:hypothetical protein [Chlorobiota bacterium]